MFRQLVVALCVSALGAGVAWAHETNVSNLDPVTATTERSVVYAPHLPLLPAIPHTLNMSASGDHPIFGAYTCEGMQDFAHGFAFHPAHADLKHEDCGFIYTYVFQEFNEAGSPVSAPLVADCTATESGQTFTVSVSHESTCIPYTCFLADAEMQTFPPQEDCAYTAWWTSTTTSAGMTIMTEVTAELTYTDVTWDAKSRTLDTTVESKETGEIRAVMGGLTP